MITRLASTRSEGSSTNSIAISTATVVAAAR